MVAVLNSCKQFPHDKSATNQIPDIVKLEERIEEAHEWKINQVPRLSTAGLENMMSLSGSWMPWICGAMHVECLADCGNNWYLERDGNSLDVLVKRRNGIHVGMEEARRAVESTPPILCDGE